MSAFAVVRFEDESASEIPTSWLCDDNKYCRWPNTKNISFFINKSIKPLDTWQKHKVTVEVFCDTLDKARKKAEDITYTDTEDLTESRRKRKNKSNMVNDSSSDSETSEKKRRTLSPPPKMPEIALTQSKMLDRVLSKSKISKNIIAPSQMSEKNISQPDIPNEIFTNIDIQNMPIDIIQYSENASITSNSPSSTVSAPSLTEMSRTINKILSIVTETKLQLQEIKQKINFNNEVTPADTKIISDLLPIKNRADYEEFNLILTHQIEKKHLFDQYLLTIGGSGHKDNIGRILKKIFCNEFAVNCSWLGLRNNFKIQNTQCEKLIREIILKIHNITEKQYEHAASEWFRHAKQRLLRDSKN